MVSFDAFFRAGSGGKPPRPFQMALAESPWPETRIIPTGFGKTAAVLAAWIWKIARPDSATPRRLVYCLPMRTLVEQTEAVAKGWLEAAARVLGQDISLSVLMGGQDGDRRHLPPWIMAPDRPAIIIGTQDMLVSAALMRGYGCNRFRWPVDFALLNNDALWVFDEVQLTGASLPTSAQLEAFRRKFHVGRQCRTLWMSATLDPGWLKTVDFTPADKSRPHDLSEADLATSGSLWFAKKNLRRLEIDSAQIAKKEGLKAYAAALAREVSRIANSKTNTIVFLNTVGRAQAVFDALRADSHHKNVILIHSRFRKNDRSIRTKEIGEEPPAGGRIIVATQALEAGVDVSSAALITEIAPWSSLVQRFGRCNRYGECGEAGANVFWVDLSDKAEDARPYDLGELSHARQILINLSACGPADLADVPPSAPRRAAVIRRRDLFELFDTDPDLSGFDIDISLYVREADDTDVRLFWRPVEGDVPSAEEPHPSREELCPAPIGGAKRLLARKGVQAWNWDALAREWQRVGKDNVFPGLALWVNSKSGGYDTEKGFDPDASDEVAPISDSADREAERALDNDEDTASKFCVSLANHSIHVQQEVFRLAKCLDVPDDLKDILVEAGLWHDLGKAHDVFKARCGLAPEATALAKTPRYNWRLKDGRNRRYFRHELASALAYLATRQWAETASLPAYLIAAHHGKVRMRIRALPNESAGESDRLFARGVWDGDALPETYLGATAVQATELNLAIMQLGDGDCGPSWTARTQKLLEELGPFRLAWLEALVRIADWRASAAEDAAGHDDV